jgi:tetrapyrrole methylase family protein/MazG family protein
MNFTLKDKYTLEDLLKVIEILRSENGCMWDREQDHKSIRRNFIEEVYEVCEAIDTDDCELLKEELGDVLFQVVFHTEIEKEKGVFDIEDVADGICKKMIYRHPHVFGNTTVSKTEEILDNWDALKMTEKNQESATDTLNSVARTLPALIRAEKIQSKAAKTGFEWASIQDALKKVREELDEVERAIAGDGDVAEEIGDLLFATAKVAKFAEVDSERALEQTCEKFIHRFSYVESMAAKQGKTMSDMNLEEMTALWNEGKTKV